MALFWVAVRIETMNLGSVFVGKDETFWGVSDFNEKSMKVFLVELNDKQLDEYYMRAKKNFQVIEIQLKEFAGNDFMLIPDAYFDFQENF